MRKIESVVTLKTNLSNEEIIKICRLAVKKELETPIGQAIFSKMFNGDEEKFVRFLNDGVKFLTTLFEPAEDEKNRKRD